MIRELCWKTDLILLRKLGEVLQHEISLSQSSRFGECGVTQHRTLLLRKRRDQLIVIKSDSIIKYHREGLLCFYVAAPSGLRSEQEDENVR